MKERTINEVFLHRKQRFGDRLAVEKRIRGTWQGASWNHYYDNSREVGLGLRSLGVCRGDRVAILSENRLEWLYADMGGLGIGACIVPIYPTLTSDECAYILSNAGVKVLFVENTEQMAKGLPAGETCPDLEAMVIMEGAVPPGAPPWVMGFEALREKGRALHGEDPGCFERLSLAVAPEDPATIVYTSGTTGLPKGAVILHKNIMAVVHALDAIRPRYGVDTDRTVPFLPLSHVFERVAGHFFGMYVGITASYAEGIDTILQDIQEKRPTVVLAVPRVCEKIYQRIQNQVKGQPPWKQRLFHWAVGVGTRVSQAREARTRPSPLVQVQYRLAYALVFKKLREALGGRVRWITASGAPTPEEIIRFFNAAGIMVIEGYGMTECTAPATMSNLADYRIGTAGRPLPGVEIGLAPDGEVLIRGDNVFKGYWRMEKESREAFTPEGFLKSGDIGVFTDEGFLKIIDRKKDLIITSGGKNIAPQKIENLFKGDPLFSQVIVIGERRNYLTALMNLDLTLGAQIAREQGIPFEQPVDLLDTPAFLRIVETRVAACNQHLARYETIKKYALLRQEFSKETGELTATLKVRRKVVREKYADIIASMYDAPPEVRPATLS